MMCLKKEKRVLSRGCSSVVSVLFWWSGENSCRGFNYGSRQGGGLFFTSSESRLVQACQCLSCLCVCNTNWDCCAHWTLKIRCPPFDKRGPNGPWRGSINPLPVKGFVPLVKMASKNSLSEKFCWPEVFVSKTLLQFGVHEKWELKQEVTWHPTDMQEPLCEGYHLTF